ncbi:MAG: hypothetical protein KBB55_04365 [Candidatus Buchananbacteria bacterium]|nr:hypothetical protein [Candidatus Buchananbacteria bacterium]
MPNFDYRTWRPWVRRSVGTTFVVFGVLALITPFTPGSWVGLFGLEMLGLRKGMVEKLKPYIKKFRK